MKEQKEKGKEKKKKGSGLKLFAKIILGIFVFLFLVILFIRSHWGQNIITDKLVNYISEKTGTEVRIDELFITFDGNISLNGLYLEDEQGDTLIYSKELEADIPLLPLIQRKGISIDYLKWHGVRANIERKDSVQGFNFAFLLDALMPVDTTTTVQADSTSAPMSFNVNELDLENIHLQYRDQHLGIKTRVQLGKLIADFEEFSMEEMLFETKDVKLAQTKFSYVQTKAFPQSQPESAPVLPTFSVENLIVDNVRGDYQSIPDGIMTDVDITNLQLDLAMLSMPKQLVEIDELVLTDSEILLKLKEQNQQLSQQVNTTDSEAFQWPEWKVSLEDITLLNNDFKYVVNDAVPEKGTFNPDALVIEDLDFQAQKLAMDSSAITGIIEKIDLKEQSGISIDDSQLKFSIGKQELQLSDMNLSVNNNLLKGNVTLNYPSFEALLDHPEQTQVDLALSDLRLDLQDLYRFQPELRNNEYLSTLAKKPLTGRLTASGNLSSIDITSSNLFWGNTSITANGTLSNLTDPTNLEFDFSDLRLNASGKDLESFLTKLDLPIKLPENLRLNGVIRGNAKDLYVDLVLNSSYGKILLEGSFASISEIVFNAELKASEFQLGKFLENPALGPVSLTLQAKGEGDNLNLLDASLKSEISSLYYNNYHFQGIVVSAELEDGEGVAAIDYKDENLNLELESFVQLDSIAPNIALRMDIIGADLQALGLAQGPVRTAMDVRANFEGNLEAYDVTATVNDGVFVYENEAYLLGDVDLVAHVQPDTTSLRIDNRILDLLLHSNAGPTDFVNALNRHYESYFTDENLLDSIADPVNISLRAQVIPAPVLEDVFLPQLEELDTIAIKVDFEERKKELAAHIDIPHAVYFGSEIDSLNFNLISSEENLSFEFGVQEINAGPLAIKQTLIEGALVDQEFFLELSSKYQDEPLLHIQTVTTKTNDTLQVRIIPEDLVLNSMEWNVDPENEILIGDEFWNFENFRLFRDNQMLQASNQISGIEKNHIGISFENFTLAALLSFLNPEEVLASGAVNGEFVIEEPFGETGLLADLMINEFAVLDVPLGDLTLEGEAIGYDTYNFDLAIRGNADLDLTGAYIADPESAKLDLKLDLNEVKMEVVEGFSQGAITATQGSFSGSFTVQGTVAEPLYQGELVFDNAGLRVAILDAPYFIPDELLRIDNEGVYFDNFEIQDLNRNSLSLSGAVYTKDLLNPAFDISFTARDFTALNSTSEDNDLFYGTGIFDATGSLTGNLMLPEVELDLDVDEGSDLTYVMPPGNVEIEEREGVVIFVNKENPNRILTENTLQDEAVSFTGFLLNSYISVEENATFKVILDPETGDNFQGSGEGDLLFDVYPNGRTTLSGRLELNDGHYEMSLYDLVSRKFDIMEGSSIVWAGDPLDADLNITAVYQVETSASALMAPQLTGSDMDIRNRYRQELEFLVYLKIGGQISEPKISFGLDMPEDAQGSIGGQVYGRVQQINQQDSELNKQVFSLLVLNRFFPDGGSDGTGGGTLGFARDNLNDAISDQLNILSDQLLGESGVDLNFGLDTYTDYQGLSPQERTTLDVAAEKSLFDDRLIVSVGSEFDIQGEDPTGEGSSVLGNVSLEYLLTEDGRFRLEAFRRKSYENVIDGQLIISGLALIFTREFNKFDELWDRILATEPKKNKTVEKEKTQP